MRSLLAPIGIICSLLILLLLPPQPGHAQDDGDPLLIERVAVVRGQGALLLDESDNSVRAQLPAGSLVILLGRNNDGSLFFVESGAVGKGWLASGSLLTVDTNELPIHTVHNIAQSITDGAQPIAVASAAQETTSPPTATPVPTGVLPTGQVTLTDSRLNLRAGPGEAHPIVGKAEPQSVWQIVGRTSNGDWLQIRESADANPAWVAAPYLTFDGELLALPTVAVVPTPPPAILVPTPAAGAPQPTMPTATTQAPSDTDGVLGGTLVFNDRSGGTIYGYSLDNGTLWPITTGIDPDISPDGQWVTFTRDGGANGVYVVSSNGGEEQLLYSGHELLRSPKWSPDGQLIVFSRSNGYDDCRVLEGGVCLPDDALLESLPPELQTGEAVNAVRGLPNQRAYRTVLSRIGRDGDDYRDIPSLERAGAPDWIDAGIVYHAGGAGIQQTADDDGMSRLVVDDELHGNFLDPDWQPGGGTIAFYRKLGGHWQIHLVNPDGSGLRAVTRPVTALVDELPSNVAPAWSPDGQHIVYLSNRNSIESAGAWHIWVMNADGSDQRRLPVDVPLDYTFSAEQMVSWGPSAGR